MEHGGLRRHVNVSHVRMPHSFTIAEITDWFAFLDDVRNDVELRVLLEKRLAVWIWPGWIELTKVLAKRDELRVGELLVMKDDNEPLAPSVFDFLHVDARQWL